MKIPRTVPVGLLLSLPIFGIILLPKHSAALAGQSLFLKGMLAYGLLGLTTAGAMACFGEGRWRDFGFLRAAGSWWTFVVYALALGAVCTFALKVSPGKGMEGSLKGLKASQVLLLVLVGSAGEEFFVRGWLQGFLHPMRARMMKLGRVAVSVPVLTGALAFGAMHLPAAIALDAWTVGFLLVFTTSLGLLAGLIRERTGSLLPAIAVHLAGNAGGVIGSLIYLAIQGVRGGQESHLG